VAQRPRSQSHSRDAGGSRTHLNRVAAGRLAVWLQRHNSSHVPARNRTWSSTFAGSCANPAHSEDVMISRCPARESNPALRLRRPPCARHTREEPVNRCPCQESNLVFNLRRVACESGTLQGPKYRAGVQGFEPCPRVLEARCSPRSTPLSVIDRAPGAQARASAGSCFRNRDQLAFGTVPAV
jgi:hypothetical protein